MFILPFDHRASFVHELLGRSYPLKDRQTRKQVERLKRIIYRGFLLARAQALHEHLAAADELAVLVDEEFGASVLADAKRHGIPFLVNVEASGTGDFSFTHGTRFADHLDRLKPTYAKALFHFDPREDHTSLFRLLRQLTRQCRKLRIPLLLEVLLSPAPTASGMFRALKELQRRGITPDLWKLEGLPTAAAWKRIRAVTQADLVVLGRNASDKQVRAWLKTAAASKTVRGFAVGRTVFYAPLKRHLAGNITATQAAEQIANRFLSYLHLWQRASMSSR